LQDKGYKEAFTTLGKDLIWVAEKAAVKRLA
jgi:hypothetical protein